MWREGLIERRREVRPGKPSREVYSLTEAGERALIEALHQPLKPDVFKSEFLLNQKQLQESGMAWTFVQPGFFMQNLLMYGEAIRDKGEFYMPLGEGKVSWLDARDIAGVAVKALTEPGHENQAYPVTGPDALGGADLATVLTDVSGDTVNYVPISLDQARQAMTAMGMPEPLADAMNELYALAPAGHLAGVLDTVEKDTGHPARSFRQFATDHAATFKRVRH